MDRWISLLGFFLLYAIGWCLCANKKRIVWKTIINGILLQFLFAVLVLGIPALSIPAPFRFLFAAANDAVNALLDYTLEGSRFIFGDLMSVQKNGFIFALHILPPVIFVASLMSVLYYLGVMQWIVRGLATIMQKLTKTSGAESLSTAANIFVGQTEAPLVVKPFIAKMTESELFCVMVGGMATVAGGVLAAYVGMLKDRLPDIAGHLLTASFMCGPATIVISKLMIPETGQPLTSSEVPKETEENPAANLIEAAAIGAQEGLLLAFNVGAMLLAFIALIALFNGVLVHVGEWIHFADWAGSVIPNIFLKENPQLNLQLIFSVLFSPIALMLGIPLQDIGIASQLLGEKVVLNEFVSYFHLSEISSQLNDRTLVILSYALCGFANFSSIAIQVGGIGGIAPSRRSDLARLGIRAIIAGSLATFTSAALAGFLY